MGGDLRRSISVTDPRLLVPVGAPAPGRLTMVDALELPADGPPLLLVLAEDEDAHWHVLPLLEERAGLRRAREGDGWSAAAASLIGSSEDLPQRFMARRRGFVLRDFGGTVTESVLESTPEHEVVAIGVDTRLRIALRTFASDQPRAHVVEHLSLTTFDGLAGVSSDLVWSDGDRYVAPLVGAGEILRGERLDEAFGRAAIDHLRGGTEAEPTLQLVDALAFTLATLHSSLATPTTAIPNPLDSVTESLAEALSSDIRQIVAEASLIAGQEVQEALRERRQSMRRALAPLSQAEGSVVLPAAPFRSLTQATVGGEGNVQLDPLQLDDAQPPRPPVADVAALLRNLDHVAYGSLRRLVGTGESVAVERAASWAHAVRDRLVFRYREHLDGAGHGDLFDEQLLLPFEIEAECVALTYATRHLSTWTTVPQMGLLDLLPTD